MRYSVALVNFAGFFSVVSPIAILTDFQLSSVNAMVFPVIQSCLFLYNTSLSMRLQRMPEDETSLFSLFMIMGFPVSNSSFLQVMRAVGKKGCFMLLSYRKCFCLGLKS